MNEDSDSILEFEEKNKVRKARIIYIGVIFLYICCCVFVFRDKIFV